MMMKKTAKSLLCIMLCILFVLAAAGCSEVKDYGVSEKSETSSKPIKIPEIKSEDTVMPTYLDISLYDVENYADIYIGEKFKYKATYEGDSITVPTTYKEMNSKGWSLVESETVNADSKILAGKTLETVFTDRHGVIINAVFYNSSKSSVSLKNGKIVKFTIPENNLINKESKYGQFWVNGVSNGSSITDIIEYLGSPSHFYAVSENEYYLDYFFSEEDKRSGITVYIDPINDDVKSITFAKY